MSDYCICKDCGCKHLVWEKSCPYCRRIAELEQRLKDSDVWVVDLRNQNLELEQELQVLREAAQKCVDETVGVIGCDALEELAELLEVKGES